MFSHRSRYHIVLFFEFLRWTVGCFDLPGSAAFNGGFRCLRSTRLTKSCVVCRRFPCAAVSQSRVFGYDRPIMKISNNFDEHSNDKVQEDLLWQPWTEVSLAGELGRISKHHMSIAEYFPKDDGQDDVTADVFASLAPASPDTAAAEIPQNWRSELFFKGTSPNTLSELIESFSSAPSGHIMPELPSVVGSDGRSAADWLIARRKGAAARAGFRTEHREAVWAEYDPDAIADYYRRRPLAVLMRLAEAGFAFAEWCGARPGPA